MTCLGKASSSLRLEHKEGLIEQGRDKSREVNRGVPKDKEWGLYPLSQESANRT